MNRVKRSSTKHLFLHNSLSDSDSDSDEDLLNDHKDPKAKTQRKILMKVLQLAFNK